MNAYLEVLGVRVVAGQLGELAHGVDADDTLESKVGLQCQPARKVIRGNYPSISIGRKVV